MFVSLVLFVFSANKAVLSNIKLVGFVENVSG